MKLLNKEVNKHNIHNRQRFDSLVSKFENHWYNKDLGLTFDQLYTTSLGQSCYLNSIKALEYDRAISEELNHNLSQVFKATFSTFGDDIDQEKILISLKQMQSRYNKLRLTHSHTTLDDDKLYQGCILISTFEKGHFLKLFGEINESLMEKLQIKLREYRNASKIPEDEWGEIIDIRDWELLTRKSYDLGKSNALTEKRAFSVYITGPSKANEYIVKSFTKGYACHVAIVDRLYDIKKSDLIDENYFGKQVSFDFIGNLNVANNKIL